MSLPQLPSYIELRTPSPEPTPLPKTHVVHHEAIQDQSTQRPEEVAIPMHPQKLHTSSKRRRIEPTLEENRHDVTTADNGRRQREAAGNTFLRALSLSEIFNVFREPDWGQSTTAHLNFYLKPFGDVTVHCQDTLETLVDRLYNSEQPGRRMSYLEVILELVREGDASMSHFLETVVRNLNEREFEILNWLACEIDFREFGARALGTAAYRNSFKAVDILLDEDVDINGCIFAPHYTPDCNCQASVITYAQLPRFDGEESGANDEMVAYLLCRGASKSTGFEFCLQGLLSCALRQQRIGDDLFLAKIQDIVRRIHGFADMVCKTESILETCILESKTNDFLLEGRLHVSEYLLDHGANMSPGSPLAALIYIDCESELELFWNLLEKTEDINAYCNSLSLNQRFKRVTVRPRPYNIIQSASPLQVAALKGSEKMVRILLQKGADVNCPARGSCGVTPLQALCCLEAKSPRDLRRKMRILAVLLESGADVNAAPAWSLGLTALQATAFVGDVEVADFLVSHGADVDAPACKYGGGTALAIAARKGHVEMVDFLLRVGAAIPAAGVTISSFGVTYDDNKEISDLLCISALELSAMYSGNGTPLRDYHEYEAEWAADPTYDKKG